MNYLEKAGKSTARGLSRDQLDRLEKKIEDSAGSLKSEAGRRIESLAGQIRALGNQLDNRFEAGTLARELEKTADYLRYRRTTDMASDAWSVAKSSPLVWAAGALLGSLIVIGIFRSRSSRSDR